MWLIRPMTGDEAAEVDHAPHAGGTGTGLVYGGVQGNEPRPYKKTDDTPHLGIKLHRIGEIQPDRALGAHRQPSCELIIALCEVNTSTSTMRAKSPRLRVNRSIL